MKKRIDSTFYFLQYLGWRIGVVVAIGFLIYSIITKEVGGIIASILFIIFTVYVSKKIVTKPVDLAFDKNFIYLDNRSDPIEIKKITAVENGVILYDLDGEITKISFPSYYFIDKNYKKLKKIIQYKSNKTQQYL